MREILQKEKCPQPTGLTRSSGELMTDMIISNIGYGLFVCLLAIRIYVGINFLDKEPRTCEVCGVDHDS